MAKLRCPTQFRQFLPLALRQLKHLIDDQLKPIRAPLQCVTQHPLVPLSSGRSGRYSTSWRLASTTTLPTRVRTLRNRRHCGGRLALEGVDLRSLPLVYDASRVLRSSLAEILFDPVACFLHNGLTIAPRLTVCS
jgi:hypothetical protein